MSTLSTTVRRGLVVAIDGHQPKVVEHLSPAAAGKGLQPGDFWDAFLFSVQTIGSINYTVFVP